MAKRQNKGAAPAAQQGPQGDTNDATEAPVTDERTKGQVMADTLRKHRSGYQSVKAYSGKHSLNNGDAIANLLAGCTPQQAIAAAQAVADQLAGEGAAAPDLAAKYARLNPGQKRMNSGNRIRGAVKRGEVTNDEAKAHVKAAMA